MRTVFTKCLLLCCLPLGFLGTGCSQGTATEEAMSRVRVGMTYTEVVRILGKPCFQNGSGPDADRAWRTPTRSKGLYIEFSEGKAVGLADFDSTSITLRGHGQFSYYIVNDRQYQAKLRALLDGK